MPKPFAFAELLAHLRALLRRQSAPGSANVLTFADTTLWLDQRKVQRGVRTHRLRAKEFDLLELLFRHPGQVFTRAQLLDQVWGDDADVASNVVDVCLYALRRKLGAPSLIATIRRVGYTLRLDRS